MMHQELSLSKQLLLHKVLVLEKLTEYGFRPSQKNSFFFSKTILDDSMLAEVIISSPNNIDIKICDPITEEEYILHKMPEATGVFVGKVREAYRELFTDIVDKCFKTEAFHSLAAKKLLEFAEVQYGSLIDFPFKDTIDAGVLRCKDNEKWYAIFMTVSKRKLGIDSDELVEIVNLHDSAANVSKYMERRNIYPAYHMSKIYWYSVCLNDFVNLEELYSLLSKSYSYTEKNKRKNISSPDQKAKRARSNTYNKLEYPINLLCRAYAMNEQDVRNIEGLATINESLNYVLNTLQPKEKDILLMYFEADLSMAEIGREYEVTTERIRQLLAKAMRKLRHPSRYNIIVYGIENYQKEEELKEKVAIKTARKFFSVPDDTSISTLDLTVKTHSFLMYRCKIETIGDLKKEYFTNRSKSVLFQSMWIRKEFKENHYIEALEEISKGL